SISPACYYARGRDFLYYVSTGTKMWGRQEIYRRENVSRVEMWGVEADLDGMPVDGLKVNLNYSYNNPHVKDFDENPALNGKRLTYAPKNQVKGYLLWTGGVVDAMFRGAYKSRQYTAEDNSASIDGFATWDIQVSRWFLRRRLYVGAEMLNIFNNRHMNTKEYMSAGRLMNLKLALHL
ncbi:MAG: TonB-dependent receptor, partial [Odoribacter sp.]|nr:TonB-dependent receptor [Odoribacter sp.]